MQYLIIALLLCLLSTISLADSVTAHIDFLTDFDSHEAVYQYEIKVNASTSTHFYATNTLCVNFPSEKITGRDDSFVANLKVFMPNTKQYNPLESVTLKRTQIDPLAFCGPIAQTQTVVYTPFSVDFNILASFGFPTTPQTLALSLLSDFDTPSRWSTDEFTFEPKRELMYRFLPEYDYQHLTYVSTHLPEDTYMMHSLVFTDKPEHGYVLRTKLDDITAMYCTYDASRKVTSCPLDSHCKNSRIPSGCLLDAALNIYEVTVIRPVVDSMAYVDVIYGETARNYPLTATFTDDSRYGIADLVHAAEGTTSGLLGDSLVLNFGSQRLLNNDVITVTFLEDCKYIDIARVSSSSTFVDCVRVGNHQFKCVVKLEGNKSQHTFSVQKLQLNKQERCEMYITQTNTLSPLIAYSAKYLVGVNHYFVDPSTTPVNRAYMSSLAPTQVVQPLAINFRFQTATPINETYFVRVRYASSDFVQGELLIEYEDKTVPCFTGAELNILPFDSKTEKEFFCPLSVYGLLDSLYYYTAFIRGLSLDTTIISRTKPSFKAQTTMIVVPIDTTKENPIPSESVLLMSDVDYVDVERVSRPHSGSATAVSSFSGSSIQDTIVVTVDGLVPTDLSRNVNVILDFSEPILSSIVPGRCVMNINMQYSVASCAYVSPTRVAGKLLFDLTAPSSVKFEFSNIAHSAIHADTTVTVSFANDVTDNSLAWLSKTTSITI